MTSFISLGELAGRDEGDPAVKDAQQSLSWGELDRRVSALGRGIQSLGIQELEHIGIIVSNRIEFLESYLATIRAGFTQTPIKTNWTSSQIKYLLEDAESKAIITDIKAARQAAQELGIAVIDLDDDYNGWLDAQSPEPLPIGGMGYRIPYTSGTTGKPKGVERILDVSLSFEDWAKQNAIGAKALGFPTEGWQLMVSQMFHGAPTTFSIGAFFGGSPINIVKKWKAENFADYLDAKDTPITSTIMVPTMFRQLLSLSEKEKSKIHFEDLKLVLHGGEVCPTSLKQEMIDWWGPIFSEYYGFTEGGMTFATSKEWLERPGTVGLPVGNMKITIVDENKNELAPNQIGALYFHRPEGAYFKYRNDEKKTAAAYLDDGSFGVGDMGYMDEAGYLFISGRTAEIIVSAGVNIYPAEIEAVLFSVKGVEDAAVVAGPDSIRGEQPVSFLVLKEGASPEKTIELGEQICQEKLARNMLPSEFILCDEIPRDPTGKTLRAELRNRLWEENQEPKKSAEK